MRDCIYHSKHLSLFLCWVSSPTDCCNGHICGSSDTSGQPVLIWSKQPCLYCCSCDKTISHIWNCYCSFGICISSAVVLISLGYDFMCTTNQWSKVDSTGSSRYISFKHIWSCSSAGSRHPLIIAMGTYAPQVTHPASWFSSDLNNRICTAAAVYIERLHEYHLSFKALVLVPLWVSSHTDRCNGHICGSSDTSGQPVLIWCKHSNLYHCSCNKTISQI